MSKLKAGLRKGHDLPVQELEVVLPGKVGMECGIASPRLPRFQPFRVSRRTPAAAADAMTIVVAKRAAVTATAVTSARRVQRPFGWATIADGRLREDQQLVRPKMRTRRR